MTRQDVSEPGAEDSGERFHPESYASWYRTRLGSRVWRDERAVLDRLLPEPTHRPALELGCGDGRWAVELRGRGYRAMGLDLSMAMLRSGRSLARARGVRLPFIRGDAHRLPVRRSTVDLVTAVTLLSFVSDPAGVMQEISRVLRPGGSVVLGELGRWSPWALNRRIRGSGGDPVWRGARFWTSGELRELMSGAGLRFTSASGAVYYPRSERAARWLGPLEGWLRERTTVGAAFIAAAGRKE